MRLSKSEFYPINREGWVKLLEWLTEDAGKQIAAMAPRDAQSLRDYRRVVGSAWDILLRNLPDDPQVKFEQTKSQDRGEYRETIGLLSYRTVEDHRAELPMVVLVPEKTSKRTVVWIDEEGKAGLYSDGGSVNSPVRKLLDAGVTVIGVDLLYQGEFLNGEQPPERQRWLANEEGYASWTYCYNLPVFARRVHDILAVIASVEAGEVDVIGLNGVGHLAAAAVAQARGAVARSAINTDGFRFANLKDVYDIDFMPGASKYGDLSGLLALAAPTRLWLAGQEDPAIVEAAFAATGKIENLTTSSGASRDAARQAVDWLLGQ